MITTNCSTARHCALNSTLYVGVGLDHGVDRILNSPKANVRKVKRIHLLPPAPSEDQQEESKEKASEESTFHLYGLALLELEHPWTFDGVSKIYPACLMDFQITGYSGEWYQVHFTKGNYKYYDAFGFDPLDSHELLAAGYGRTEPQHHTFPVSPSGRGVTGSWPPSGRFPQFEQWKLNFVRMKRLSAQRFWIRKSEGLNPQHLIAVSNPSSAICYGMKRS